MELTADVHLRGTAWDRAINDLGRIFKTRTNYSIYLLCMSIGIMYDQRIDKPVENGEDTHDVPRNVMQNQNNDFDKLDFMFQAAILTTLTENFSEEERLDLAFGDKRTDFNKLNFLTEFANFGVTKLVELIGTNDLESMDNIKNFLAATMEGRNFDVDMLPDELIEEDVDVTF